MAIAIMRKDYTAEGLRREAARCRDGHAARRMLALALALDGCSRSEAATLCGMDRQTLRDWVHRYEAEGLAGLHDRSRPGRPPGLSPEQEAELARIVEAGPSLEKDGVIRWRRIDLQKVIAETFGISLHERSVGRLLRKLRFRRLSPRPRHPKTDTVAQETFKKEFSAQVAERPFTPRWSCSSLLFL
jgi:transposase